MLNHKLLDSSSAVRLDQRSFATASTMFSYAKKKNNALHAYAKFGCIKILQLPYNYIPAARDPPVRCNLTRVFPLTRSFQLKLRISLGYLRTTPRYGTLGNVPK